MHLYLLDMLACPICHGGLDWEITEEKDNRIETAQAICPECSAAYPVREGVGLFLTPDLQRDDLWEQVESQLVQALRKHPELEEQLMGVSKDKLGPADLFYRAMVLEERGEYLEAKEVEQLAEEGIYTPEYGACLQSQCDHVIEQLSKSDGPIVDLASGRCSLVEMMAQRLDRPIIATDFSPQVLRRNRRWLGAFGLYDKISLLAFDARRAPFKEGAVSTLTTNLGLPNIREPGKLLPELRRVVSGRFLTISHFYPEEDKVNARALREAGLSMLFRDTVLEEFSSSGWQAEIVNRCAGNAQPTPMSAVLEGAGIDSFPVVETILEWCVIDAQ